MKRKLLKTAFLEIKIRKKIFISILCMSLLGVGFFAGIKSTSPAMKNTIDAYYKELNMYDIEVISPTGFVSSSFDQFESIEKIEKIEGVISYDTFASYNDKKPVVKLYSITNSLNKLNLVEGRMPEDVSECVIDERFKKSNEEFEIGDYIEIESQLVKNKKLKIVGIVNSPLYISAVRGSTTLGTGTIDYFLYMPKDNFIYQDVYTSMYVKVDTKYKTNTSEYDEDVSKVVEKIKNKDNDLYVMTRNDNVGYSSFIEDTERIDNIAKIFPIIFFIVATLISLTSMTRMVEEQRIEIGTLKSLGYTTLQISIKYLLYASIATIVGGILGILIGVNLIPRVIYLMYSMMYTTNELIVSYNLSFSLLGLIISYLCIIGATIYAILKEIKNYPAVLMRPKAPKSGKRVLLERIPIIWKHLNFTNKVTVRNLFRYKKRFLMTILGIGGTTSLIFAGFALKDSVSGLLPSQYENIFKYELEAISTKSLEKEDLDYVNNIDGVINSISAKVEASSLSYKENRNDEAQIMVFDKDSKINDFIKIRDYKTKDNTYFKEGVVLTEKLASLLEVNVGDKIEVTNSTGKKTEVEVNSIAENYLYHYVYMTDDVYEKLFAEEVKDNVIFMNTEFSSEEENTAISEKLLKNNNFSRVVVTATTINMMNDTMKNLNYVVWVLIVSAGILAICVLYNLANVNISERVRELATLKVLGFYDNETHSYIEKETTILTVIGIILGIFMGYFLSIIIIKTCELDIMKFPINFSIYCYLLAIIITILFTVFVSITTYFNLKKINMIESLKSVE